jgi:hypothetical protein
MQGKARTEAARIAYPDVLKQAEAELLAQSQARKALGVTPYEPQVGVALSGGGIRSATLCLGVFQALAKQDRLGKIDFLSTVSGGGYFGACLGRLFTRAEVKGVSDVQAILSPTRVDAATHAADSVAPRDLAGGKVLNWLRENGRHLSPNGAGDLLLGLAVIFRNWLALHLVLLTFVLMLFLAAQCLRIALTLSFAGRDWWIDVSGFRDVLPGAETLLWWSPYVLVAAAAIVLCAIPAWAYWMVWRCSNGRRKCGINPLSGMWLAIVLGAAGAFYVPAPTWQATLFSLVAIIGSLAFLDWLFVRLSVKHDECGLAPVDKPYFDDLATRHRLSLHLKFLMVVAAGLAAFALIDSIGQTLYAVIHDPDTMLGTWLAGIASVVAGIAIAAQRIASTFGGQPGGKRLRPSLQIVATLMALALLTVVLSAVSAVSHGIAWEFKAPLGVPANLIQPAPATIDKGAVVDIAAGPEKATFKVDIKPAPAPAAQAEPQGKRDSWGALIVPASAFLVTLVFTFLFGRTWPFLNHSSQHPLYTARLIRAYLGASNPRRLSEDITVTQLIPGDDIEAEKYWARDARAETPFKKGAPLHLINTTLNETFSGHSQVEQRDRKGLGMAIGPAGLSMHRQHHLVYDGLPADGQQRAQIFPADTAVFRVFDYRPSEPGGATLFTSEQLSLGEWVGISGAAFSTGLGARTHLGLSLLAGFFNVRTGYWWDSDIKLADRVRHNPGAVRKKSVMGRVFTRFVPAVSYLMDEFIARFHGPMREHWYLSDGGHFENMGAYELIRRRLPLIVVVDAECDTDYSFEGLANLIRKARIDFEAEVEFLDESELDEMVHEELRACLGSLAMLRRGTAGDRTPYARARAALARVRYEDEVEAGSWLLYLKPTLCGDEPADLIKYHHDHPDFPQETTADQFFDEAQWESYRKLGQHMAGRLFKKPASTQAERFAPFDFTPPRPQGGRS